MYGAESRARDGAGDRAKKVLVLSPLARKTSHFWDWRRSQEHDPRGAHLLRDKKRDETSLPPTLPPIAITPVERSLNAVFVLTQLESLPSELSLFALSLLLRKISKLISST